MEGGVVAGRRGVAAMFRCLRHFACSPFEPLGYGVRSILRLHPPHALFVHRRTRTASCPWLWDQLVGVILLYRADSVTIAVVTPG